VKTNLAKGSYIIVVYWQIKLFRFFDQVPIFLKKIYFVCCWMEIVLLLI